ncbi:type II secretion system protein [Pseudoduganella aquatica]|uniref:Prepilin-type N-terminal cleavage/methylation domain-containing protein n=1 Tax=Pseudoduganella aquatica TaxID=2660641 RepID=A0A7X4KN82_9BURK|nr:type II secretion system protein [Pseudoduganella aquatica]MYN07901.1 prepilin-type N-terminal cleavage/methylation domain-containing protein [Pseudoduganella aquatica]
MRKPAQYTIGVVSPQRRRGQGFSLLELAVVAIIFSVLAAVLLQRLAFYQDEAERAGAQLLVANMRSALYSKALEAAVQQDRARLAQLVSANPIRLLEREPENYKGEIDGLSANKLEPGFWYFNRDKRILVYVFRGKKSFPQDLIDRWYFKVEFSRLPTKDAKPDGTHDQNGSVALIQVDGS